MNKWLEPLQQGSDIRLLIEVLCDKKKLRELLRSSSVQLSMLIGRCYAGFDHREVEAVSYQAARACRRNVSAASNMIQATLKEMNIDMEAK